MKKITTSIFVPSKFKKETSLIDIMDLYHKLNTLWYPLSDNPGLGALDDIKEGEEFELIVNGEHEKYTIVLKGANKVGNKLRLLVKNVESKESQLFLEWRIKSSKLITLNNGKTLQLKNFSTEDLRRLIRHAFGNQERKLVNYR